MAGERVVDAALFLGMHSADDHVRQVCKGFFVEHLADPVVMSLEQVGMCDDVVWGFPRAVQDAYYPFMDVLHTEMDVRRVGYDDGDLRLALDSPVLAGLSSARRLLMAMVLRRGAVLHTVDPVLADRDDLPTARPASGSLRFPPGLEGLYRESSVLRLGGEGRWVA
jgi:hypothetical protein